MGKYSTHIRATLTFIVGATFIVSSIMKLQSIDTFELYIFSFNLFNLNLSALIARLVIGVELAMGVGYLANIYHKQLYYTIFASLIGFTLFLFYLIVVGREDNCHCFGDIVHITPAESILKNIVLIVLLYFSKELPEWRVEAVQRYKSYLLLLLCVVVLAPFIRNPHRAMYELVNKNHDKERVNVELFDQFLEENPQIAWGKSTKILCFYGTHCKYCRLSIQQLTQIVKRNNLDIEQIELVFWGKEEDVADFSEKTNALPFKYTIISPVALLNITNGKIPTILFYDEESDHSFKTHNMRSIEESDVIELLQGE